MRPQTDPVQLQYGLSRVYDMFVFNFEPVLASILTRKYFDEITVHVDEDVIYSIPAAL